MSTTTVGSRNTNSLMFKSRASDFGAIADFRSKRPSESSNLPGCRGTFRTRTFESRPRCLSRTRYVVALFAMLGIGPVPCHIVMYIYIYIYMYMCVIHIIYIYNSGVPIAIVYIYIYVYTYVFIYSYSNVNYLLEFVISIFI